MPLFRFDVQPNVLTSRAALLGKTKAEFASKPANGTPEAIELLSWETSLPLRLGGPAAVFDPAAPGGFALRDPSRIVRTTKYIEGNPVSAGLASCPEDWPWSSAGWQAEPPAPQEQVSSNLGGSHENVESPNAATAACPPLCPESPPRAGCPRAGAVAPRQPEKPDARPW
jgi:hypothetical protein